MLVKFKSKAAAEVLMYEDHAKRILDLLGKDVKQGIITAKEAAQAVARIEEEIAVSRAEEASVEGEGNEEEPGEDNEQAPVESVRFATRAYPLLEMLRAARDGRHDVVWGV